MFQAIVYEGQDKNPEMCRVLLTHEVMCRLVTYFFFFSFWILTLILNEQLYVGHISSSWICVLFSYILFNKYIIFNPPTTHSLLIFFILNPKDKGLSSLKEEEGMSLVAILLFSYYTPCVCVFFFRKDNKYPPVYDINNER